MLQSDQSGASVESICWE